MSGRYLFFTITVLFFFINSSYLWAQHEQHIRPDSAKKRERIIHLEVGYKWVNYAGKARRALAINNQIPAPTLHFKEGEQVHIIVHNRLNVGTSIHWHGILVPWQMDGVENISQKAIPPGGEFHYRFMLRQSGTYWYHAHAEEQEQEGLYGAFLIEPKIASPFHYNKDYVIVLSDWSNIPAHQIFQNLKKDGDYFSPKFPLQPSLSKFIHDYSRGDANERKALLNDYKMMQQMRMSIYDLSDVAYDAFLMNGRPNSLPWQASVQIGDTVRLRFIGAGGSTIFRVKIHDAMMQMVHIQGNNVKPFMIKSFDIAPGETYDVLVKIKKNSPYIIYAESIDTVGAAIGALTTSSNQVVDYNAIPPFPEPLPTTRQMMANMSLSGMHHSPVSKSPHTMMKTNKNKQITNHSSHKLKGLSSSMSSMNMSDIEPHAINMEENMSMDHTMAMPTEPSIVGDLITPIDQKSSAIKTVGTKYQNLKTAIKTNNPNKSVDGVIHMELFGYMDRFIWFINGVPEYKAKPILIEPSKRYRIIFTNNSMMRHPMHIHGHWFILRNGHGAYDPLLHTINVPPGATVVADFDTDASGQWFFHCHHLYHMMAGMARTFQYQTIIEVVKGVRKPEHEIASTGYYNRPIVRVDEVVPINKDLIFHPLAHHPQIYFANFLDIGADPFNHVQRLTYLGLHGPDYNKLELFINDAEFSGKEVDSADLDMFYWHQVSQFWAIKGGVNYFYQPAFSPYWQAGIGLEGTMPYFIVVNLRSYYYKNSVKLDLDLTRDTQITNNLFFRLGIRSLLATKTVLEGGIGNGLNQMRYTIGPYYRLMPGLNLTAEFEHEKAYGAFKTILHDLGQETSENTFTLGISIVF